MDKNLRIVWLSLDYLFDTIYLIDIFIQSRTGELKEEFKKKKRIFLF